MREIHARVFWDHPCRLRRRRADDCSQSWPAHPQMICCGLYPTRFHCWLHPKALQSDIEDPTDIADYLNRYKVAVGARQDQPVRVSYKLSDLRKCRI